MSKKNKIIIISLSIISVITFIVSIFIIFMPNHIIETISKEKFTKVMQEYNCDTEILDEYYITKKENCPYLIKYNIYKDKKSVKNNFIDYLEEVRNNKNVRGRWQTEINIPSYQYNERTTIGDNYKSVTTYNNTILYIETDTKNLSDVINIKKSFGYFYEPNWKNIIYLLIPSFTFIILIIYIVFTYLKKEK